MKIIAITTPDVTNDDASIIKHLLDRGIDIVHLRKPHADVDACRALLAQLSAEHRARIVVHDYPELYYEFSLRGIHLNSRVTSLPQGYDGLKTRSCHTLEEVAQYKDDCDYLFLSPIFDSISKPGYASRFTDEMLCNASAAGIIDQKVIALGGVTLDKIAYLQSLNFGGAAMLGSLYNTRTTTDYQHITK